MLGLNPRLSNTEPVFDKRNLSFLNTSTFQHEIKDDESKDFLFTHLSFSAGFRLSFL